MSGIFPLPSFKDNADEWGPSSIGSTIKEAPLGHYGKADRISAATSYLVGVAPSYQGRSRQYKQGGYSGSQKAEDGFQLVENKSQNRYGKSRPYYAKQQGGRYPKGQNTYRRYQNYHQNNFINRKPSVVIQHHWIQKDKFDIKSMSKEIVEVGEGEILYECGKLGYYNKSFDRITPRQAVPLKKNLNAMNAITSSSDVFLEKFAHQNEGKVFATENLLSYVLNASRSVFSWDLILNRVDDKLFLDAREKSDINAVTVSEDPNDEMKADVKEKLQAEAGEVYLGFREQFSGINDEDAFAFKEKSHFKDDPSGYLYKRYDVDGLKTVVRISVDSIEKPKESKELESGSRPSFLKIYSLMESFPSQTDWKNKLEVKGGAVLASELRNNSFRIARWATIASLSNSGIVFGFVSRKLQNDYKNHLVLGTKKYKPGELEGQINLKLKKGWGLLKNICSKVIQYPPGKYIIIKDPISTHLTVYQVREDEIFENTQ